MGRVHCLSGSSWTPVWAGLDQSSRTCSDTADQPDTARSGDQMNRRKSPGELTLQSTGTSAPPDLDWFLFFHCSKKKKDSWELNKRVRCPVAEGRTEPPVLPKAPVWNIKQRQFPCCRVNDPLGLPPLWADWARMTRTLKVVWKQIVTTAVRGWCKILGKPTIQKLVYHVL